MTRVDMLLRLADEEMPAAVARRVAVVLLARHLPELADDVALVVAELVANAENHGGGPAEVGIARYERGIAVTVTDRSGDCERIKEFLKGMPVDGDSTAESGRGLALVDACSTGWSVDPACPAGATVTALFRAADPT
ncbi:ATP-binding protein [Streptomyces sp. BE20]|uniref:ATP-binding protein n=1 Tax=Streptomyces sp. BE20 TaxID=3002525 RepID=UPI002E78AC20|nr:ATP-binding protein [Streptomyces sp. BE20]MEE1820975.1 ATP-binding protein [Streptomyces sp. BE20]